MDAKSTPAANATHYAVLGVAATASAEDIKKAYRALALTTHPDRLPPSQAEAATAAFKRLATAWFVLSDSALRLEYDHSLQAASVATIAGSGGGVPIAYDVDLEDMHFRIPNRSGSAAAAAAAASAASDDGAYYYPCRCGDEFMITERALLSALESANGGGPVVSCSSCSLNLRVSCEVAPNDDDDASDADADADAGADRKAPERTTPAAAAATSKNSAAATATTTK